MDQSLGALIKAAREAKGYTVEKLAAMLACTPHYLRTIENGTNIPAETTLCRLHSKLVEDGDSKELALWLLKRYVISLSREQRPKPHANRDEGVIVDEAEFERVKADGVSALQFLCNLPALKPRTRLRFSPPTLADFPDSFVNDLIIVTGDRRESDPKTRGDIFADSFSCIDFNHIRELLAKTGPLRIRSDKVFMEGSEDYLKKEFSGKHILCVGSPSVNFLSRKLNGESVFRFAVPTVIREFMRYYAEEIHELLSDRTLLRVFWEMASHWSPKSRKVEIEAYYEKYKNQGANISIEQIQLLAAKVAELLKDNSTKDIMNKFRKPGFMDPADACVQGETRRNDNDFGVISLCPNPYSDDGHVCILVAGISGPGTDQAMRMLSSRDFRQHPLGGVIEVKNLEGAWLNRLDNATSDFQTKPYDVMTVAKNLANHQQRRVFRNCSKESIARLERFVNLFLADRSVSRPA